MNCERIEVSVIVPFHDDIRLLRRAVESIVKQKNVTNCGIIEIVVSSDSEEYSTEQITIHLENLIEDGFDLKVCKNIYPPGPGSNRNNAIEKANGQYIAFLDADDEWLEDKLMLQLSYLRTGYNFSCTGYTFRECNIHMTPPRTIATGRSLFFSFRPIGTSTVMISRDLLNYNRFPDLWLCQDLIMWARLLDQKDSKFKSVKKPLCIYSMSSGRTSFISKRTTLKAYYIAARSHGIDPLSSIMALAIYTLRGIYNKHILKRIKLIN